MGWGPLCLKLSRGWSVLPSYLQNQRHVGDSVLLLIWLKCPRPKSFKLCPLQSDRTCQVRSLNKFPGAS